MKEQRTPITVRVSPTEHATIGAAAKHLGLTTSAWLRMVALAAAREALSGEPYSRAGEKPQALKSKAR